MKKKKLFNKIMYTSWPVLGCVQHYTLVMCYEIETFPVTFEAYNNRISFIEVNNITDKLDNKSWIQIKKKKNYFLLYHTWYGIIIYYVRMINFIEIYYIYWTQVKSINTSNYALFSCLDWQFLWVMEEIIFFWKYATLRFNLIT